MTIPAVAIFLCDYTGIAAEPWAAAGVECWCIDVRHSIRRERARGNIRFIWGDVRSWYPRDPVKVLFAAAFPPCTHVAVSGARDFEPKGGNMLRDALETFEACRQVCAWSGAPYMIENPRGILSSIPHIGPPDYTFDPNEYGGHLDPPGDAYTKETCLWVGNGFVMPPRVAPGDMFSPATVVDPVEGSRMWKLPPSDDRAAARSETPRGFASAVFLANRWVLARD